MNKRFKILVVTAISFVFLFTVFTGDSIKAAKQDPSWTLDKSPLTITWFVDADWYQKNWDIEKCLLDKKITEDTGITVEVTSGNSDKFNVLIASGNLPDVVTTWFGSTQRQLLEKNKLVQPFNQLVDKYAPDFKVPKSMQNWFRNEDGNYYGYVNYFYAPEDMQKGNFFVTHNFFQVRKDLADKLGIKVSDFNTKKGVIAALKKVKAANLQYNGLKVAPFYPAASDLNQAVQFTAQQFGSPYENKQGTWLDWRKNTEALESLKFYNTLYNDGLMSTDAVTLRREQIGDKVANGAVFMVQGRQVNDKKDVLKSNDPKAVYEYVGPIKGEKGKYPYLTTSGLIGWTMSMITTNAKKADRIIRFMNYLAQPEMVLNQIWGPKGEAWDMVDGHVLKKPAVLAEYNKDWTTANHKYGDETFTWMVSWLPVQRTFPKPLTKVEADNQKYEREVYGKYVMDDKCFDGLVVDAGTEEAGISAKLEQYWTMQVAKMIVSKPDAVDKLYKETITHMDELGWSKWSKAIDLKFKENKAKLGIKYAYPPLGK